MSGSKKILIACWGSRGDIEPAIALAQVLRSSKIAVTIASQVFFEQQVTSSGFSFERLSSDTEYDWESTLKVPMAEKNFYRRTQMAVELLFAPEKDEILKNVLRLAPDFELIITNAFLNYVHCFIAKLNIRSIVWYCWPQVSLDHLVESDPALPIICAPEEFSNLSDFHEIQRRGGFFSGHWRNLALQNSSNTDLSNLPMHFIAVTLGSASRYLDADFFHALNNAAKTSTIPVVFIGPVDYESIGMEQSALNHLTILEFAPHELLFKKAMAVICQGGGGVIGEVLRSNIRFATLPIWGDQALWTEAIANHPKFCGSLMPHEISTEALADILKKLAEHSTEATESPPPYYPVNAAVVAATKIINEFL